MVGATVQQIIKAKRGCNLVGNFNFQRGTYRCALRDGHLQVRGFLHRFLLAALDHRRVFRVIKDFALVQRLSHLRQRCLTCWRCDDLAGLKGSELKFSSRLAVMKLTPGFLMYSSISLIALLKDDFGLPCLIISLLWSLYVLMLMSSIHPLKKKTQTISSEMIRNDFNGNLLIVGAEEINAL